MHWRQVRCAAHTECVCVCVSHNKGSDRRGKVDKEDEKKIPLNTEGTMESDEQPAGSFHIQGNCIWEYWAGVMKGTTPPPPHVLSSFSFFSFLIYGGAYQQDHIDRVSVARTQCTHTHTYTHTHTHTQDLICSAGSGLDEHYWKSENETRWKQGGRERKKKEQWAKRKRRRKTKTAHGKG